MKPSSANRLPSIRQLLALIVLIAALPAFAGLGLLIKHFYERERALIQSDSLIHARAVMHALERDLTMTVTVTRVLAASPSARREDFKTLYNEAAAALTPAFPGLNFVLSDRDANQIFNTLKPYGDPIPDGGNLARIRRVFDTGQPYVSDVFTGGVMKRSLAAAHVPVWVGGEVKYVLSVGLPPERVARVLADQRLSASRRVAILDASGVLVAHSHSGPQYVGRRTNSLLLDSMKLAPEGMVEMTALDGVPVYAMFSRSQSFGWAVGVGVPRAEVLRSLLASVAVISASVAVLFIAGLLAAMLLARRVGVAIQAFVDASSSLGQRVPIYTGTPVFREATVGMAFILEVERELNLTRHDLECAIAERTAQLELALTELRNAQRETQLSSERMATILDNALDAFVGMDNEGCITEWNKQAERVFGWPATQVKGSQLADVLVPERLRAAHSRGLQRFLATGIEHMIGQRLQLTAVRRNGEEFPVEMTISSTAMAGVTSFNAFINDISERKRTEVLLESERILLNTVLDTIHVAVVACDGNGALTLFNRASRLFHGLDAKNIAQDMWPAYFSLYEGDGVTPMTTGTIPLLRALRGEVVDNVPMVIAPKRQVSRSVLVSARRLIGPKGEALGAVAAMSDVTEQNAAAARLVASERFLLAITNNSPALIGYVNCNQIYQFANLAYKTVLGKDPAWIVGRSIQEVMGENFYALLEPYVLGALQGERQHFEPNFAEVSWPFFFMTDYLPDIGPDGTVIGFHIMVTDISERKRAEVALERSKRLAEDANKAKSEFVANMSHEIRTPMNAVLGLAQLLEKTTLTQSQQKYLSMLQMSGKALLSIINDILDFSKIEAGRLTLASSPFHLNEILNTAAAIMTASARHKNLELIINVGIDVPSALIGDAMRLQQAVLNLIGNAIKFTETGEVSLSVTQIRRGGAVAELCFSVTDTGIGMSADQLARLFTPFEQADSSTSRRFGGTGLGLAISKQLVELMGGTIVSRSVFGQGSSFDLTVPMKIFSSSHPIPVGSATARQVLIIDDNARTRTALEQMLDSWHWKPTTATSINEAMDLICCRPGQPRFDAILIDWELHQHEGRALLSSLNKITGHTRPAVFMTVNAFAYDEAQGADASLRGNGILMKPVTPSSLYDALNSAFAGDDNMVTPSPKPSLGNRLHNVRVLVVEDNQLNQLVARAMLEGEGARVITVSNGQEAFDFMAAPLDRVDVVLMDIQMPVMDGYEATRRIRFELNSTVPILAMSAGVMIEERERCLANGMDDFIAKPVDIVVLISTIMRHVKGGAPAPSFGEKADTVAPTAKGVFDIGPLLKISQRNPAQRASLLSLVERAIARAPEELAASKSHFRAGKLSEASGLLHALRGALSTFGARRFAATTIKLENAIKQEEFESIEGMYQEAEREFEAVRSAATECLSRHRPVVDVIVALPPATPAAFKP